MKAAVLFSYAILPKRVYPPKTFEHNNRLHPDFSLTAVSAFAAYAAHLLHQREQFDRILVMGCKTFGEETPADSEIMAGYLRELGVASDRIIVDQLGINFAGQVERAASLLTDRARLSAITLACHSTRAGSLFRAYGFTPSMVTIEEVFRSQPVPRDLYAYFEMFTGSAVLRELETETRILLLLQRVDPKGRLQKLITRVRGIRYFDVDIPPTLAGQIVLK